MFKKKTTSYHVKFEIEFHELVRQNNICTKHFKEPQATFF